MRIFFPMVSEVDETGLSDRICEVKTLVLRESKDTFWIDIPQMEMFQEKIVKILMRIIRIICNGGMWDLSYEIENIPDDFNGSDSIESLGLSLLLAFYHQLLGHYNKSKNYNYNQKLFEANPESLFYKELINHYIVSQYDIVCISGELEQKSTKTEIEEGECLSDISNIERKFEAFINSKVLDYASDKEMMCFIYVDKEGQTNEPSLKKILSESNLDKSIKERISIKRVRNFNDVKEELYEKKPLDNEYCIGPAQVKNVSLSSYTVNNNIYDRRIRIEWDAVENAVCYEVRKFEIDVLTGGFWYLIYPIYNIGKENLAAWENWSNYDKSVAVTAETTAIDNPHIKENVILTNHYYKVRAKNKKGIWGEASIAVNTEDDIRNEKKKSIENDVSKFFKNLFDKK